MADPELTTQDEQKAQRLANTYPSVNKLKAAFSKLTSDEQQTEVYIFADAIALVQDRISHQKELLPHINNTIQKQDYSTIDSSVPQKAKYEELKQRDKRLRLGKKIKPKQHHKPSAKTKIIHVRMTPKDARRIRVNADALGISAASYMRRAALPRAGQADILAKRLDTKLGAKHGEILTNANVQQMRELVGKIGSMIHQLTMLNRNIQKSQGSQVDKNTICNTIHAEKKELQKYMSKITFTSRGVSIDDVNTYKALTSIKGGSRL